MKTVRLLPALLLVIALGACNKDSLVHSGSFSNSYIAWLAFKDSSHNSYRYAVGQGSVFGYGSTTIITVKNGKVVERSFQDIFYSYNSNTGNVDTLRSQWHENETQLSTHEKGAAPVTLDDIYKEAKDNWLRRRDDADTYFEAKNHGMISSCGYVTKGCADDCFRGITITFIEPV